MYIVNSNQELTSFLTPFYSSEKKIGFVATMGALHAGHLDLVHKAREMCDVVVVSVFVNPKQFNNPEDLKNYPRNFEKDSKLLSDNNVDVLFFPSVEDVYPENIELPKIQLGVLDQVLEGEHRPGHFLGVAQVIYRFFEIIQPDIAFFGIKDVQQVAVVKSLVNQFDLPVEIEAVEISREPSGLARSSRNERLSEQEKEQATIIYKTLNYAKEQAKHFDINEIEKIAVNYFNENNPGLKLEYLSLVNGITFETPDESTPKEDIFLCTAAWCGNVRLIDNMQLFA